MKNILFGICLTSIFLISCGKNYIFEKSVPIQNGEWAYSDTLNFNFEIQDTTKIYNLYLDIDHSTDYGFQNLYINVYTKFPSGERIKEMLSVELAAKGGIWFGDCDVEKCKLEIPIQQNAFFNIAGSYEVTVEQYMRKNPLSGISGVSFKIEDTGNIMK
ncbi:MAG: gliding motility lipoprotein GldH [Bacteroidetes bacterium]|jgi:gliding motility-associated lipoprotein GldH|nr:gliding motility lipoprotein GldH [Bacteroidota bacterium]MDF1867619.1 gliding motility lipoprotein GldH [Saprospiraceae bacterium]